MKYLQKLAKTICMYMCLVKSAVNLLQLAAAAIYVQLYTSWHTYKSALHTNTLLNVVLKWKSAHLRIHCRCKLEFFGERKETGNCFKTCFELLQFVVCNFHFRYVRVQQRGLILLYTIFLKTKKL